MFRFIVKASFLNLGYAHLSIVDASRNSASCVPLAGATSTGNLGALKRNRWRNLPQCDTRV
jgi:hypothetical protein